MADDGTVTGGDASLDLLGIKPMAKAINTVTEASIKGMGAFLSRICLPAAEELGLLLKDKVSEWRTRNAIAVASRAEKILNTDPQGSLKRAHPRLVGSIMNEASWVEEDEVLNMWAGLLASGCTLSGKNQQNLIYVNLLKELTASQVRILNFVCTNATKIKTSTGLLAADKFEVVAENILELSGLPDIFVLDVEIDHLRHLGLIDTESGLSPYPDQSSALTPTNVALQLYIRAQGFVGSPLEFFDL